MSFETALRARLKANADLAGASVEWAQRLGYPSIRLTLVSLPLARHMTGFGPHQRARVQIDVFALSAPVKVALREAVLATIAPAVSLGGIRFGRAQEVSVADQSEETDTEFVHRDAIEAVLPFMMES